MDESHRIQPITISDISHLYSKIFETSNPIHLQFLTHVGINYHLN
jgi:hypothetical protein